jgi:hypothetical protein
MGRMRVALFIGVLVMQAVGRNPEERSTFQGQGTAYVKNYTWRSAGITS